MYFNHNFIKSKYISHKKKRKSFNKIFISKAETKHINSKAIITIFVYNREKLILLKKIRRLKKIFAKLMIRSKILQLLSFSYSEPPVTDQQATKINFINNTTNVLLALLKFNLKGRRFALNKSYKELYDLFIKISKK